MIEIVERQRAYDPSFVDQPEWVHTGWREQKLSHILYHVGKAGLKLDAGFVVVKEEIAPDMAMACAQTVLLFDIEPSSITYRAAKATLLRQLEPLHRRAFGHLSSYLEPDHHSGMRPDVHDAFLAAQNLHAFSYGLADFYGFDLHEAHATRLEQRAQEITAFRQGAQT